MVARPSISGKKRSNRLRLLIMKESNAKSCGGGTFTFYLWNSGVSWSAHKFETLKVSVQFGGILPFLQKS